MCMGQSLILLKKLLRGSEGLIVLRTLFQVPLIVGTINKIIEFSIFTIPLPANNPTDAQYKALIYS